MKLAQLTLAMIVAAGLANPATTPAAEADPSDQRRSPKTVRMAVQGICPVTGNRLGSHGEPVKAKIGEETMFLCCKGCASGEVDPQHWATIHANFAEAQGICPVMEQDLPEEPKWTIVEGRIVYVCCPPCIDKIEADPETYLDKVDGYYRAWVDDGDAKQ